MKIFDKLTLRSTRHNQKSSHVTTQRKRSLYLLIFGIVRIICWMILGTCVLAGMLHIGPFDWAFVMSKSVPFVALISIYANWATDLDAATAAFAALVAADSHSTAIDNREMMAHDFADLEVDISRLAEMQPGPAAHDLAESIRARVKHNGELNG